MKKARVISVSIGSLIMIQWVFFIITRNVPEFQTAPISISFHIFIEVVTALVLISIYFILKEPCGWKVNFAVFGQGMLAYTAVNSAGYFAQSGQWIFIIMFLIILTLAITNVVWITKDYH